MLIPDQSSQIGVGSLVCHPYAEEGEGENDDSDRGENDDSDRYRG